MKKGLWLFTILAGLVACTDDAIDNGKDETSAGGTKNYIALKVMAGGGNELSTRSREGVWPDEGDSFDKGRPDEWALSSADGTHWAVFFNEDGSYYGRTELDARSARDPQESDGEAFQYEEMIIGTYVAEVNVTEGKEKPTKCLVILNGRPDRLDKLFGEVAQGESAWRQPNGTAVPPGTTALDYVLMRLSEPLGETDYLRGAGNISIYTPQTGKDYCTMTSSTYVEGNDVGRVCTWTDIAGYFAPTPEETKGKEVIVHVDRLPVKVELLLNDRFTNLPGTVDGWTADDGQPWPVIFRAPADAGHEQLDLPDGKKAKWGCVIWGWSTNAEERRTYLFKNLDDNRQDVTGANVSPAHYRNGDIATGYFTTWNTPERHRCYWAVDGHYAAPDIYPAQYRKILDEEDGGSYRHLFGDDPLFQSGRSDRSPLFYYTYKEIWRRSMGYAIDGSGRRLEGNLAGSRRYRYIPENTLALNLLQNNVYRSAATHVVVLAQLLLGDETGNEFVDGTFNDNRKSREEKQGAVSDKYMAGNLWYDKAGYMQMAYTTLYGIMKDGKGHTFQDVFGKTGAMNIPGNITKIEAVKGGTPIELTSEFMKNLSDAKALDDGDRNPFVLIPAEVTNGDGKVMLALRDGWTLRFTLDGGTTQEWNATTFQSAVYAFVKAAKHYLNGRMYYYIPIRHARAKTRPTPIQLGDIGVVRNHWYRLTITDIKRPGLPIPDPDQPIIPDDDPDDPDEPDPGPGPDDPEDKYLGLDIHIVPWHVITQELELH